MFLLVRFFVCHPVLVGKHQTVIQSFICMYPKFNFRSKHSYHQTEKKLRSVKILRRNIGVRKTKNKPSIYWQ